MTTKIDALPVAGEREAFEAWLRSVCIAAPPAEAYDLALCAYQFGLARAALAPTTPVPAEPLLAALIELADIASQCDSWQSFPDAPLQRAYAAVEAFQQATPAQQTQSDAVAGAAPTDAQIQSAIWELVGDKSFPDTTPNVPSYWLNSDDIRDLFEALSATPPQQATPTTKEQTK